MFSCLQLLAILNVMRRNELFSMLKAKRVCVCVCVGGVETKHESHYMTHCPSLDDEVN